MFRLVREAVARLFAGPQPDDRDLPREVRAPDPYVWRLPSPYDARWCRWSRRSQAAGRYLPMPLEEDCWQVPRHPGPPARQADDTVVRPYVLRP